MLTLVLRPVLHVRRAASVLMDPGQVWAAVEWGACPCLAFPALPSQEVASSTALGFGEGPFVDALARRPVRRGAVSTNRISHSSGGHGAQGEAGEAGSAPGEDPLTFSGAGNAGLSAPLQPAHGPGFKSPLSKVCTEAAVPSGLCDSVSFYFN